MSDALRYTGDEALEAAFGNFLEQGVGDVDMNPQFPAGIYHFKMNDFSVANDRKDIFRALLTENMTRKARERNEEPKAMGFIDLKMKVINPFKTDYEGELSNIKGRGYTESIIYGERSLPQLLYIAAGILGTNVKELQESAKQEGMKLPALIDALAGQEFVAKVVHTPRKSDPSVTDVSFDYGRTSAIFMQPAQYIAEQQAA